MKRSRDDRDQTGSDRVTGSASMNVPGANRGWRVIHQSLVIWNLNMRTKSLMAFVDFRIKTTNPNLKGEIQNTSTSFNLDGEKIALGIRYEIPEISTI